MKLNPAALVAYLQPTLAAQVILGPVYDKPTGLPSNPLIKNVTASIIQTLQDAFTSGKTAFNATVDNGTALSVTVASTQGTLLDFHHTPAEFNKSAGSVTKVNADTSYRIGSISKLFTVYAFLLVGGRKHWDTPVGHFIPELNGTDWKDITLGALASQLGGIGKDYVESDFGDFDVTDLVGFPKLTPDEILHCGGDDQPVCSRKEFLKGFPKRDHVTLPYTTPNYSNAGYQILAYAIEAIANRSYESVMSEHVLQPLNLKHSSVSTPKSGGFIPNGPAQWDFDLGGAGASGGIYSSTRDLATLGLSILRQKQLSSLETRRWLKPHSHTAGLHFSVGAPWEIWRTEVHGRIIDLYTKGGDIGMYHSYIYLIPEYEVVVSVLAGGQSSGVINAAIEETAARLLPVLDDIAQKEACDKYCGHYKNGNSSLVLKTDDQPGILISEWKSRGKDVLVGIGLFAGQVSGAKLRSVRLYPKNTEAFRALMELELPGSSKKQIFAEPSSLQWSLVDIVTYGGIAIDEFVLDGKTATPKVMRQTLHKV